MSQEIRKIYFSKTPIPAAAFLPQSHIRVYNAILSYQGGMDSWTGTIEVILKRVNGFVWQGRACKEIKPRRASQIIQDLKKWGWLEVKRSGYSKPNSYKATTPTDLLFQPEHSYESAPVPRNQVNVAQPQNSPLSRVFSERDNGNEHREKCGTDPRSKDAKLSRVSGDAELYKELEKNSKELIQEEKMNMEQNGKIVFAAFADWASSRLTKSSNEDIQSVLHGTKKYNELSDSIKLTYSKYKNEEYPKLQRVS
ncbi:hypothetical protein LEP1GSC165_0019 [Leptospira santarosai str. CBC523]|uniref:hypothetical protein n=1 Tax=Leptospira santarosai TaxID=28183 RepID=UPI0002BF9832|nr:hypothetical protein [Leptospira santarosai]EMO12498.1 hypothetical protein LEP1GSC165_0019 [Leptospira santarosai str. CBC523]